MTYQESIEFLYASAPMFQNVGVDAYKEGLANTILLDNYFGNPHTKYKTIHVAGTNGKGSCSHTIAAILQQQGYKVGLYTSPHLVDFRERIRVNGEMIPEKNVCDFINEIRNTFGEDITAKKIGFSFFELATALAFKYFADENVDIAVVEVGLGGRLDCTNIISPILSVITNISLDHTQFLGNTLSKIAKEKAGIIKSYTPVVIGETTPETKEIFVATATEHNAPIYFAEDYPIESDDMPPMVELGGNYQTKNTRTIITAIKVLENIGIPLTTNAINYGFANVCKLTGLRGRWEKLGGSPLIICDTGHNIGGWQYLVQQIAEIKCDVIRMVLGFVNDKDINGIMQLIQSTLINKIGGNKVQFYFTQASVRRALSADKLSDIAQQYGLKGSSFSTVADAYFQAIADSAKEDFIYIGGSTFIVADLLKTQTPRT